MKEEKSVIKQPQLTAHQMLATTQINSNIHSWLFALFSIIHSGLISQLLETVLSAVPLYLLRCLRRLEGWRGYMELN